MTLSSWLMNNDCSADRRAEWAISLAQQLEQCSDGRLNPGRIEIDEFWFELSLNNPDEFLSPEILEFNLTHSTQNFLSAVFSYGLILDYLYRGSPYMLDKGLTDQEFLQQVKSSEDCFEAAEGDPLKEILRTCLAAPQNRPQSPEALKALLVDNAEIKRYLRNNPDHEWANDINDNHAKNFVPVETNQDSGLAVGIDLGTSNSTVAYYQAGKYKYLEFRNSKLIPSAIYFKEMDQSTWIYGNAALSRGVMYPDALFKHFKRHIGETKQQIFHTEPQTNPTYIIDTNIFIENPRILEGMENDAEIIIPKTVYEELGRRKNVPETASEAEVALQSIDEHRNFVKLEDSHLELLTSDMFTSPDKNNNDRNDNKIISVALFHDGKKTILLSNDKMIAEKAEWQEHSFQVQNSKEFSFYRNMKDDDELKLTGKDGATIFLKYLRDEICQKVGDVNKAVITVPQEFSPIQNKEIREAANEAGFTDIELQTEPVAAAVAYGLELTENQNILIYDFGGGTFDVTILGISDGNFNRIASGGDPKLGGEDFTQALIDDFKIKLASGEILPNDEEFDMESEETSGLSHEEFIKNELNIWKACEDIKCNLSYSESEEKNISLFITPGGEPRDVTYELTRSEFKEITAELIVRARKALDDTLKKANFRRDQIDVIILAGGTSTIPFIAKFVEDYFGKKPYSDRDPATLIAEGAALFADIKWNQNSTINKKIKIFDKTMTDLGVALKGAGSYDFRRFDVIIPVNSALPMQQEKIYSLVKDNQEELEIECFTREELSNATNIPDKTISYIGKVKIAKLPQLKRSEVDVFVTFQLTREYELAVEVNLKDKQGNAIDQSKITINTMGV